MSGSGGIVRRAGLFQGSFEDPCVQWDRNGSQDQKEESRDCSAMQSSGMSPG